MKNTRIYLALALLLSLAACAPAAGRPAIAYVASPEDVISAVAQFGPQIQPSGGYNFLGIETIGDRFISLAASTTTGVQILSALGGNSTATTIRVTVTLVSTSEQITQIAISALPTGNSVANSTVDTFIRLLDERFRRAPQPATLQ